MEHLRNHRRASSCFKSALRARSENPSVQSLNSYNATEVAAPSPSKQLKRNSTAAAATKKSQAQIASAKVLKKSNVRLAKARASAAAAGLSSQDVTSSAAVSAASRKGRLNSGDGEISKENRKVCVCFKLKFSLRLVIPSLSIHYLSKLAITTRQH